MGTVVPFPKQSRPGRASKKLAKTTEPVLAPRQPFWRRCKSWLGGGWFKAVQAMILAGAVFLSLGATDTASRYNDLSHRMMCVCGCSQLVGECNHVGCQDSAQELSELRSDLAAGMGDQQILNAFVAKYGATVLAAPPAKGFDLIAWIAPFAVFAAALLGTILLIRRWGGFKAGWFGGSPQPADAANGNLNSLDPEERARRERIRRDVEGEI